MVNFFFLNKVLNPLNDLGNKYISFSAVQIIFYYIIVKQSVNNITELIYGVLIYEPNQFEGV